MEMEVEKLQESLCLYRDSENLLPITCFFIYIYIYKHWIGFCYNDYGLNDLDIPAFKSPSINLKKFALCHYSYKWCATFFDNIKHGSGVTQIQIGFLGFINIIIFIVFNSWFHSRLHYLALSGRFSLPPLPQACSNSDIYIYGSI